MSNPTDASPATRNRQKLKRLDWLLPVLTVAVLGTIAIALWAGNGRRVFVDMLAAAWAYCF